MEMGSIFSGMIQKPELRRRCRYTGGLSSLLGGNMFVLTEDPREYKAVSERAKSWGIWEQGKRKGEELKSKAPF